MQPKRFKILIIPGLIPYPPDDGGKLCIYCFIDHLRKVHDIQLLLSCTTYKNEEDVAALQKHWPDVVIHQVTSIDSTTENSFRNTITHLAKRFFEKIAEKIEAQKPKIRSRYDWFTISQTTPFYPHDHRFVDKLASILADNQFDIIQTELTPMLNLVNMFPSSAKKIFVQIEERAGIVRDFGVTAGVSQDYLGYVAGNTEHLEFSYMKKYDAVFALNDSDKAKIQEKAPSLKVYTSPYGLLDRDLLKQPDSVSEKPENLILIGGEIHYPNVDALNWFVDELASMFNPRPFKKVLVTGRWSDATKARIMRKASYVEFLGFVDDLSYYLHNSLSIVPIRIGGGGIRTKILTAMMHGAPVVSTTLGAVGIKGAHGNELLIADSAEDFVLAINDLFHDQEKCNRMRKNAYDLVVKEYSQTHVSELRNELYHKVVEGAPLLPA
jgi:glycosyltransferase involved in cell wall biosynthesis